MQVDAFTIRLRTRTNMEAADLGVRLCQSAARSVFRCYAPVVLPVIALALAVFEIAPWLPGLVLWLSKPWLDRTILFVLSRAAFGQPTASADVWQARRQVWWGQIVRTWTTRRLSPWRSFTQPVYQLEGLGGSELRQRVAAIRTGKRGAALLMTSAFGVAEWALIFALLSLTDWFVPQRYSPELLAVVAGEKYISVFFAMSCAYAVVVAFLEPFYVAAGFAMYLNRRVELEAWDIEQEFRRAFTG
jgi:hypothetical protein